MTPILETNNVCKQYDGHTALDSVSLKVPQGIVFGLLGPNGAGKTTLIRIINQITAPDSGTVLFDGHAIGPDDIYQIGYMPEERGLYKKMKVGEQAVYLAQLKGLSKADATQRLKVWFDKFEIGNWWNRKVEELSKGMQQKVQFITTVLHEPKLLIFDEPFSGFDPINANLLKEEILNLKDKGATVIFSTHNMASVEEICDHIALINKSRKVLDGTVGEIRQQFKLNIFELGYIGDFESVTNIIEQFVSIKENAKGAVNHVTGELKSGFDYNQLIQSVLSAGAQITQFSDVLPSMNDIFIKAVNQNENTVFN
ncbi:MAG: ATP-binding cassette domain-containing protein [Salinivirgaceae bacterium]|nr:ATP-binding cassette domain-containing protein [Salinivirgaceae bacterium]